MRENCIFCTQRALNQVLLDVLITAASSEITILAKLGIYKYYAHICVCSPAGSLINYAADSSVYRQTYTYIHKMSPTCSSKMAIRRQ